LADDENTDQGLRRLLGAFSRLQDPPSVLLHGPLPETQFRFSPDVGKRLDLSIVTRPPRRLQMLAWSLIRAWLRVSVRIRQAEAAREKAVKAWHEWITARWHAAPGSVRWLAFIVFLLAWPLVTAFFMVEAFLWGLAFPVWMLDRIFRRIDFVLCRRFADMIYRADCCVWLVPHPVPWPLGDVPAVLLVPPGARLNKSRLPDHLHGEVQDTACSPRAVFAVFCDHDSEPGHFQGLPETCIRTAPSWSDGSGWLNLLRQARDHAPQAVGLDHEILGSWPRQSGAAVARNGATKALLFLQIPWGGGNWEHTRELVCALNRICKHDGRLHFDLAIHVEQTGTVGLPKDVRIHRCRFNLIERTTAMQLGADVASRLMHRNEEFFCFLSGAAETALEADVWLALSDRFPLPLLPARPYGVVVHDMIHRHVPEAFNATYFRNLHRGVRPTVRHADLILTTSEPTKNEVVAEYGIPSERVVVVPVACEPHRRFGCLPTGLVPLPRRKFLLNVTNASPHKGADLMLQAYSRLKHRLGPDAPLLVLCGINTQFLSARHLQNGPAFWMQCRDLQRQLGLVEGQDVVFLGPVTDIELKDLYSRCQAVVNAARYDNGTYCLIEAAWFGKPVVSTCYPGVESLVERFGLPVQLAPINDPDALADALEYALRTGEMRSEDLRRFRNHLEDPRYSVATYAGRMYELLLDLASRATSRRVQPALAETALRTFGSV
jgi:glycosyltransferase involved in cell wall biosynthesis